MAASDVIETTVAEVTAELLRRGVGPDEPVSIVIEPAEELALARRKSRVRVVAGDLADASKQAQREVEPRGRKQRVFGRRRCSSRRASPSPPSPIRSCETERDQLMRVIQDVITKKRQTPGHAAKGVI